MNEMIDDDNDINKERLILSPVDDDNSLAAAAPSANDRVSSGDINNGVVGTPHAPSPPLSPSDDERSNNDALSDDDDDNGGENDDEEEEEYETSYAKLQKLRRNYATATPAEDTRGEEEETSNNNDDTGDVANGTKAPQEQQQQRQRRRRRGGYGSSCHNNAASVLESLNDNEGAAAHAITAANDNARGEGADDSVGNTSTGMDTWNLDDLDIVDDTTMDNVGGEKSSLFLDEDVDTNGGEDGNEEDDDATRPYDDRSHDDEDNDEEMEMEEKEDALPTTGRGRTKQKHVIPQKDQGADTRDEVEEEQEHQQTANHGPSNEGAVNPTNKQIVALVDKLFQAADKDNMTVGGILSYVAEHFGFKDKKALGKERKQMIKEHLTLLVSGKKDNDEEDDETEQKKKSKKKKKKRPVKAEGAVQYSDDDGLEVEDEDDAGGNDSSSDYEEEAPSKKKSSKKSRKKKSTSGGGGDDDDSDHSDYSDDSLTRKRSSSSKRKKRRIKGSSKKGKMKNHLRDEATKRRLRQMEEARIRQEEMGHLADDHNDDAGAAGADSKSKVKLEEEKANVGPQISEQDRQRAMAIAARFDTNREELRVKREEDRVGLIGKLRQRRLESIAAKEFLDEMKKEDTLGVHADKYNEEKADVKDEGLTLAAPASENNEDVGMIELDDDSDDDDSDDDDLEIKAPSHSSDANAPINAHATKPKPNSMLDSLLSTHGKDAVRRPIVAQIKSKSVPSNPRMALRNALRVKQVKAGNLWLAR